MKNTILVAVAVVAVASAIISVLALTRFESLECRELRAECRQECDDRRDGLLNDNRGRRNYLGARFQERIIECDRNFDGEQGDQCKATAADWMSRELSLLDGLDRRALRQRRGGGVIAPPPLLCGRFNNLTPVASSSKAGQQEVSSPGGRDSMRPTTAVV